MTLPPYIEGVDLSTFEGDVDAEVMVAAGIRWVILKATQGIDHIQNGVFERAAAFHKAGVRLGYGHFFEAGVSGVGQAQHYRAVTLHLPTPTIQPVLDLERSGSVPPAGGASEYTAAAEHWCAMMRRQAPGGCLIRCSSDVSPSLLHPRHNLGRYDCLVPRYGGDDGARQGDWPSPPRGWPKENVVAHAYTSKGCVPGIEGDVDRWVARRLWLLRYAIRPT